MIWKVELLSWMPSVLVTDYHAVVQSYNIAMFNHLQSCNLAHDKWSHYQLLYNLEKTFIISTLKIVKYIKAEISDGYAVCC